MIAFDPLRHCTEQELRQRRLAARAEVAELAAFHTHLADHYQRLSEDLTVSTIWHRR